MTHDIESVSEIDGLMRAAVGCALACQDFATALGSFRQAMPATAPNFLRDMPLDEDLLRAMTYAMFRDIWKILPRPDHGWRPLPAPKAERNAPCICGSGRKFKQCCGQGPGMPPFGEGLSVLGYVLERIPADEFARLPFKLLSPEELAHAASEWLEQNRHEEAIALLEPLLADPARLDERHEYAFDTLCDAYLDVGRGDDRRALVESLLLAPDRQLRSAAMHRRCTMYADEGDYDAASRLFREAQRADPDNPALAHLELVLLASQQAVEQLATRARFWAARLRKLGYEGERLVDFVDDVARNPEGFMRSFKHYGAEGSDGPDDLDNLAGLIGSLPATECRYRLQPTGDSAGRLEPDAALAEIERDWKEEAGFDAEEPWPADDWVAWLAAHPLAWQSFAVLEDIVSAVDDFLSEDPETESQLDDIEDTLLGRAGELLGRVIAENHAEGLKLEWGWLENRPALRLLALRIELEAGTEEELPLLEWLVLTLNPNDNQGFREELVHGYAAAGRAADALAVCDRYPDDALAGTLYGRVLALFVLGREEDAAAALAEATQRAPLVARMLTAQRPRAPKILSEHVTAGGDNEAWGYRQNWFNLWQSTGALAWLKRASGVRD